MSNIVRQKLASEKGSIELNRFAGEGKPSEAVLAVNE